MKLATLATLLWLLFAGVLGFQLAKVPDRPTPSRAGRSAHAQIRPRRGQEPKLPKAQPPTVIGRPTLKPTVIADNAMLALVSIKVVTVLGDTQASGTGFFVADDLVATCYHVVRTARLPGQIVMHSVFDAEALTTVRILATDAARDLAILQLASPGDLGSGVGRALTVTKDLPEVGSRVFTIGNPLGVFEGTFSDGMISSIREGDAAVYLQITAPISAGSSGGPVLNERAEVVGVTALSAPDAQNINFAVASAHLRSLLQRALSMRGRR